MAEERSIARGACGIGMGCGASSPQQPRPPASIPSKPLTLPKKWAHASPITQAELDDMLAPWGPPPEPRRLGVPSLWERECALAYGAGKHGPSPSSGWSEDEGDKEGKGDPIYVALCRVLPCRQPWDDPNSSSSSGLGDTADLPASSLGGAAAPAAWSMYRV